MSGLDLKPIYDKPRKLVEQYPLDAEGLTNKSVILSGRGDRVLDYGAIPFLYLYTKPADPNSEKIPSNFHVLYFSNNTNFIHVVYKINYENDS